MTREPWRIGDFRRIAIVGTPGGGKTTLARRIAGELGLTHIELDSLYHQPGWQTAGVDEFRAAMRERFDQANRETNGWVTCGNFATHSGGLHIAEADTVLWIDLPRSVHVRRVLRRTIRRSLTGEELWHGNKERIWNLFKTKPEDNIVLWTWREHGKYRRRYEQDQRDGTWSHLVAQRLYDNNVLESYVGSAIRRTREGPS